VSLDNLAVSSWGLTERPRGRGSVPEGGRRLLHNGLRPIQTPVQRVPGFFPQLKRPGREADQSHQSSGKKDTPPLPLHDFLSSTDITRQANLAYSICRSQSSTDWIISRTHLWSCTVSERQSVQSPSELTHTQRLHVSPAHRVVLSTCKDHLQSLCRPVMPGCLQGVQDHGPVLKVGSNKWQCNTSSSHYGDQIWRKTLLLRHTAVLLVPPSVSVLSAFVAGMGL
jgi:hypothetical protein